MDNWKNQLETWWANNNPSQSSYCVAVMTQGDNTRLFPYTTIGGLSDLIKVCETIKTDSSPNEELVFMKDDVTEEPFLETDGFYIEISKIAEPADLVEHIEKKVYLNKV